MRPFRYPAFFALFALLFVSVRAAETKTDSRVQNGKMSTVRLLKTARLPAKDSPGGMGFLFLVSPAEGGASTGFTLKETKDFQVAGASYQEKTQTELGKRFEPGTEILGAEKFFAANPRLKPPGLEVPKGAVVLSLVIRGIAVPSNATAAITLHVGFDQQAEPFTFTVPTPG